MGVGVSLGELAALIGALLAAGFATGLLAGLLGIGGGGILVPVLYELFGSLGLDEVGADASRGRHVARGDRADLDPLVRGRTGRRARSTSRCCARWRCRSWLASGSAALLARHTDAAVLKMIWVGVGVAGSRSSSLRAAGMATGRRGPGETVPALYGGLVGLVSTLMSIGGGVFVTALMTLYGHAIQSAVATSSGFGPLIASRARSASSGPAGGRRPAAGLARLCQPARRAADHPDQRAARRSASGSPMAFRAASSSSRSRCSC